MSKGDGADSPFEQVMRELEQVSQSIGGKTDDVESTPPSAAMVSTPEPAGGAGQVALNEPQLRQSLEDIERSLDEQAARRNDMLARLRQSTQRTKTTAPPPRRPAKATGTATRSDATAAHNDVAAQASTAPSASRPEPAQRPVPKPKAKTKAKASVVIPPRAATPLNDSVREALARTEARRDRLRKQNAAPPAPSKPAKPQPAPPAPNPQIQTAAPPTPPTIAEARPVPSEPPAAKAPPMAAQGAVAPTTASPKLKAAVPPPVAQGAPLAAQSPISPRTTAPVQSAPPSQSAPKNDAPAPQRRTPAPVVDVPGAPAPKNGTSSAALAPDFPNPFANIGVSTPAGSPVMPGAPAVAAAPAEQAPPAIMAPKARTGLVLNTAPMPKMFDGAPIAAPPEPAFPASAPPLEVEKVAKAPPPFKPSKPRSTPSGVVADFAELGLDTPAPQKMPEHPPELGKGYVTQSYTFKPEDFVSPSASDAVLGEQKSKGGLWRTLRRTAYALAALAAVFAAQYYVLANHGGSQEEVAASTLGTDLGSGFGEARISEEPPIGAAPVDHANALVEAPTFEDTAAETASAKPAAIAEALEPAEPIIPQALLESAEAQSRERILQIQSLLQVKGYDVPSADGEVNTQTLIAIQAFQANRQIDGDDVGPRFTVELRLAAAEGHRAR